MTPARPSQTELAGPPPGRWRHRAGALQVCGRRRAREALVGAGEGPGGVSAPACGVPSLRRSGRPRAQRGPSTGAPPAALPVRLQPSGPFWVGRPAVYRTEALEQNPPCSGGGVCWMPSFGLLFPVLLAGVGKQAWPWKSALFLPSHDAREHFTAVYVNFMYLFTPSLF